MERSRRHWWKVAASLALAASLLAWFLSRVPLADVVRTLATVRLGWFGAAIVASLSSYALRALRWRVILRPLDDAPTADLLGCTAAGFATSAILPARAGARRTGWGAVALPDRTVRLCAETRRGARRAVGGLDRPAPAGERSSPRPSGGLSHARCDRRPDLLRAGRRMREARADGRNRAPRPAGSGVGRKYRDARPSSPGR